MAILGFTLASLPARAGGPAVVELFESQGCSSCPPADRVLDALSRRGDLLALTFPVTYWDELGWKDTFAQPAFTQRQYDHASHAGRSGVWTPQFVVDGTIVVGGSAELEAAIARRASQDARLEVAGEALTVHAPAGASVWLVQYDPGLLEVKVTAGENRGQTLAHRNVVKRLTRLGEARGGTASFTLPSKSPGLARAVLAQAPDTGAIVAALALDR